METEEQTDDRSIRNVGRIRSSKYGFRLTPEEQELAYQLKGVMMDKVNKQSSRLQMELSLNKKLRSMEKQQKRAQSAMQSDDTLTRTNAIKLMRLYERRCKEAEDKSKRLEAKLEEVDDLAKRYHDMYLNERNKTPRSAVMSLKQEDEAASETGGVKKKEVTDADLDDDKALYKRHIERIADTKSMITTSPIRVQDIIKKNEKLIEQNESLRHDVQRLKEDNARLVLQAKRACTERDEATHHLATSEAARAELLRRVERQSTAYKRLNRSLTRQAADWVRSRQEREEHNEANRWAAATHVDVLGANERTYTHPNKKNTDLPRRMHPVQDYAKKGGNR